MVSWGLSVGAVDHLVSLVTDCGIVSTGEADMLICTAWHMTLPRSIIPLATDSSILPCLVHEGLGRGADCLSNF